MGKRIRHFVGVESSEQLAFIDELHALGLSSSIELPELIVVGDQNTGKSSVLQAITEVSFPVQERTCTRFPIQISFRQTTKSKNNGVTATITPGRISKDDEAFVARAAGFRIEKGDLTQDLLKEMIDKAAECMFGKDQAKDDALCDATLRIERSGPDEIHWSIVDLPGLIRNSYKANQAGDLTNGVSPQHGMSVSTKATIAENIVRSYLDNKRNIVLLILGDSDVELSKSLEIVTTVPGITSRAIGVLNKCDKREEGAGGWMVSLLQNNLPTAPRLDHGWFGLRNRKPNEPHFSDAERDEAEERDIIAEIRQKLTQCETQLKKMGEARTSPRVQRFFVHQFCSEMQRMADACLLGQYQDVSSDDSKVRLRYLVHQHLDEFTAAVLPMQDATVNVGGYENELKHLRSSGTETWQPLIAGGHGMYPAIYEEAMISRGKSLPGTVHPDVEEKVFRRMSAHWVAYTSDLVERIKDRVRECYDVLLRLAIPNNRVRLEVSRLVSARLEEWNRDSDSALQELIEDNQNRPLYTKNPLFESQVANSEKQLNEIFSEAQPAQGERDRPTSEGRYIPTLLSNILQTRVRLEAYYEIAAYRFIDNVATQVIERHVLGPKCPLRAISAETFTQLEDDELNRVAGEDKADALTRKKLEATRDSYRKALARWEQLSVL
ncbi:P-loop containing nucleoside triphosphate hydrolase protein [Aspergillus aurantiobrunneus]